MAHFCNSAGHHPALALDGCAVTPRHSLHYAQVRPPAHQCLSRLLRSLQALCRDRGETVRTVMRIVRVRQHHIRGVYPLDLRQERPLLFVGEIAVVYTVERNEFVKSAPILSARMVREAYVAALRSRMLQIRATLTALHATHACPQSIARRIRTPADDHRRYRHRGSVHAVDVAAPNPKPRRGLAHLFQSRRCDVGSARHAGRVARLGRLRKPLGTVVGVASRSQHLVHGHARLRKLPVRARRHSLQRSNFQTIRRMGPKPRTSGNCSIGTLCTRMSCKDQIVIAFGWRFISA
jgi:hypothetical protein